MIGDDLYESAFDPREYLRTYYETPHVTEDEVPVLTALSSMMNAQGRPFGRVLEVGCGPTIHHAIPLVPFAEEIHLSDYLAPNLAEVRRWLDGAADAHDWDVYLRGVLAIEGREPTVDAIRRRAGELRRKVTALPRCDLLRDEPLGHPAAYDLVTCFYTAECAARSPREWEQVMRRLGSLVRPGGRLFQVTMREGRHYNVAGRAIPSYPVNETDLADVLPRCGFDPSRTTIRAVRVGEWAGHGFAGVCIVEAGKV
jgi:SAM-dependent methyltransferase